MIESHYWRKELAEEIRWLKAHRTYKRWSEKQMVLYERKLMLVAFQVRSLLERPKINSLYASKTFDCIYYPKIGIEKLTHIHIDLDNHFAFDRPVQASLNCPQLCNQLIHYYVMFAQSGERGRFTNLLVASDFKRNVCLFNMDITALIDFFDMFTLEESALGHDGKLVRVVWNEKKGDYDFIDES